MLVEDERVRLITFTGSAEIGWRLRERAPRKRVNLELGNATPVIVEADADVDDAAARCAANAFSFAGQSCISVQRIYVQRGRLRRASATRSSRGSSALVVGDPADEDDGRRAADLARTIATACSPGSRRRAPAAPRS